MPYFSLGKPGNGKIHLRAPPGAHIIHRKACPTLATAAVFERVGGKHLMNVSVFARAGSVALGALLFASPGFSQYDRAAADKVYKVEQPTSGKVGSQEW